MCISVCINIKARFCRLVSPCAVGEGTRGEDERSVFVCVYVSSEHDDDDDDVSSEELM